MIMLISQFCILIIPLLTLYFIFLTTYGLCVNKKMLIMMLLVCNNFVMISSIYNLVRSLLIFSIKLLHLVNFYGGRSSNILVVTVFNVDNSIYNVLFVYLPLFILYLSFSTYVDV